MSSTNAWFRQRILSWYKNFGRSDLPWKNPVCAYRIWVSEIMLQQTQVTTVIDYFNRFMARFPSIEALATAEEDEVFSLWAGLGYYARARNLHKTAKMIHEQYQGTFPEDIDSLMRLPGIGPSTAAAIMAQAFDKQATILDGNVKRFLSRFFCVAGPIDDRNTLDSLWQHAQRLTPQKHVADYTQAIMDIGATVCTKSNPSCSDCPVQNKCLANLHSEQHKYPEPKRKKHRPTKKSIFLGLRHQDDLLLEKRPAKGIWGGLYSLLAFESQAKLKDWCENHGVSLTNEQTLGPLKHTFTHFHLEYKVTFLRVSTKPNLSNATPLHWMSQKSLTKIGLPAPIKKVLLTHL